MKSFKGDFQNLNQKKKEKNGIKKERKKENRDVREFLPLTSHLCPNNVFFFSFEGKVPCVNHNGHDNKRFTGETGQTERQLRKPR